jgi:putative tryptophan/tyrosine transport system substrate-binding protein
MRRREFIAGLGSAAARPATTLAQQTAMPVIGYLGNGPTESARDVVVAFQRGLAETGYIEGRNGPIRRREPF